MNAKFDAAFDLLMKHEGGYSDHAADPGRRTMYGVTEAVARRYGYTGDMRDLPLETAKRIYFANYWRTDWERLAFPVCFALFDGAVNSGMVQSVRWIQRALGVADDGIFGPVTLGAAMMADPNELVRKMSAARLDFLSRLSTWPAFGRGWARRIAANLQVKELA